VKVYWQYEALKDYKNWAETDPVILETINDLIDDIKRWGQKKPEKGRGQPKRLKRELKGWWSRQITKEEHRLVYRVKRKGRGEPILEIAQCRGHY
jgi:toxin YoeB